MHKVAMLTLLLSFFVSVPGLAASNSERETVIPPHGSAALDIGIGLWIENLGSLDQTGESYLTSLRMTLVWKDSRLAGGGERSISPDRIWTPTIYFANQKRPISTVHRNAAVSSDGTVTLMTWLNGEFSSDMDFREFPFDTQELMFDARLVDVPSNEARFHPLTKQQGIAPFSYVSLAEWSLGSVSSKADMVEMGGNSYSRFVEEMDSVRNSGYYLWKLVVPMCLIIFVSWTALWLNVFSSQLSISMTSMLTLMAYNFTVSNNLPRVSYLTLIDAVILLCYCFAALTIVWLVFSEVLNEHKHPLGVKFKKTARFAIPAGFLLSLVAARVWSMG
jgi:hypothetical protein